MWQSDLDAAKRDAGKPRLSLVPPQIIFDIAQVREYGNRKYGSADNWKEVGLQRYIDALYRHMLAFVEDNRSRDAESGIEHYKHMACNMAFICQLMKQEGAEQNRACRSGADRRRNRREEIDEK